MELHRLREQICQKDLEIIRLIAERMDLAEQVGETKRENGLPIVNEEVEKKVIARYVENGSAAGIGRETLESIAKTLIREAVIREYSIGKDCRRYSVSIIGGGGKMGLWMKGFLENSGHAVSIIDPAVNNGLTIADCASSDIVIISVPIRLTDSILTQVDSICSKDTLIFDLSSLKSPSEDTLRHMAIKKKVCSVHPMFGPSAESMYGRNLIICDCGNKEAVKETNELFKDRGGRIRIMDLADHDMYMSYVLGLTHAVNISLFTVLERSGLSFDDLLTVASTTFNRGLDTNRSVASEDPLLYYEIQHMNSHRDEMWNLFSDSVKDLRDASISDDPRRFAEIMSAGRRYFGDE